MARGVRWSGVVLAIALGLLLAIPMGPAGSAGAQGQRVVVTNPSIGLFELPFVVGQQRGYFQQEGLDVTTVQMTPPVSVAALLAGDADYSLAIDAAVSAIVAADAPLKLVVGYASRPLHVLMVNDPTIQSVSALRGRSLGISALSGASFSLARLVLQAHGLEPQVDVSLQALGASPNRLAALLSGQVPAVILDLAYVAEARRQGARLLVHLADVAELPIGGLATTETILRTRPAQVEAMIRASLRGTRFMRENRDETVAILMSYLNMTRDVAEVTYDLAIGSYTADGVLSDRGLQTLIDTAQSASGRTGAFDLSRVADWSIARRVVP